MFPGRTIADRYRVLRVLGRGGMGVVSEVEAVETGQHFAIKFLRDDVESDVQPNARFAREAKLATRLASPHVCRVTEIGEWELGPYLVMELLEGRSLSAILEDKLAITWQQVVRIAYEMCDALGEAHRHGIVHRDVKPGNVFIAKVPGCGATTKMLDFGVAKIPVSVVTAHGDRSLTDASTLLGTPSYVAPEQLMNSKLVDARADVWAVGVLMYEMLGKRLPFCSPLVPKLLVMIARDEPAPLSTLAPEIPAELVQIVHACLQKKPDQRFENAAVLADALTPWLDRSRDLLDSLLVPPSRHISIGPSGPPTTLPPLCEATQAESSPRIDPAPASHIDPASAPHIDPASAPHIDPAPGPHIDPASAHSRLSAARSAQAHALPRPPLASCRAIPSPAVADPLAGRRPADAARQTHEPGAEHTGDGIITRKRRARIRWLLIGSGIGTLIGVMNLVWCAYRRSYLAQTAGRPLGSASAPASVLQHSVLVLVDPAQARIDLDGREVPSNPAHLTGADDGHDHPLVLSAPGYRTEQRAIRFDRDQQLSLALAKQPPDSLASTASPAPGPSAHHTKTTHVVRAVSTQSTHLPRQLDTENPF